MSKPKKKSRLLLEGNKLLGSLIYFEDKEGRDCLKLSFKNKVSPSKTLFEDIKTGAKTELASSSDETSVDISYKFKDSILELKEEVPGKKKEGKFLKVPIPIGNYLFLIRLKDWHHLNKVKADASSILLETPSSGNKIAVFFSFAGVEGKPFVPKEYWAQHEVRSIPVNLPNKGPLDKIWIGVVKDEGNNGPYNLEVKVPQYK